MRLVGIETATRRLSVALWLDGDILGYDAELANGGSEHVLPWVGKLLAEAGIGTGALDAIAFGAGPGSFTGLRLACGVAQGLAWGLGIPVVAISTLEALALASGQGRVWACLDARMNEIYSAAYQVEGGEIIELMAPTCAAPAMVPVPAHQGMWGAGDGFGAHGQALLARKPDLAGVRADAFPTAAAVLRLAAPRLAAGRAMGAALAQPTYVRDKVALTSAERLARGGLR